MLSYQHIYHAGNLADVHKHSLLAWMLAYLTRKDKPVSYIETHGGRALYDLGADEALKTGEAAQGIARARDWFAPDHPYIKCLTQTSGLHGQNAYPGSPLFATQILRDTDSLTIAELHPAEHNALELALPTAKVHRADGFAMAHSILPPTPRRGLMLIDPSYEIKDDYQTIPGHIRKYARAWNVGIIVLWYPILTSGAHNNMLKSLEKDHHDALRHEVRFPPARPGHGMVGSGLFVIRPPFGLAEEAAILKTHFDQLK
ncbi:MULTISPECIES: 23S rRNA (adenine(2030)-N(6))-methyltransferase RlmJ [Roseobacteraceae]|uniref:23S rRNA (adenine(2030)-N(6))-methyltransferase RlmJ n=1 Tax=Roseobacteraceae TaxID=2854170 RepID=UPI001C46C88B|nr:MULTISPECIES: 23S rRNA (adenine(2030)-N(6))-methyltransferase RlmJ [Roseobacteraceae]MBV7408845.1 23S rRNA (adenine(2030)-N(6))-methyltransferase RlmJ [Maritimibacter sp. DP1N21-5]MBY5934468.1 23S rRNA (adenine(2030)-N(6))-methyltransferase RlmJ [Tateyamaria omphalii]